MSSFSITRNSKDAQLSGYIAKVNSIPRLSAAEESSLYKSFKEGDLLAKNKLIAANLYIVLGVAFNYRSYGLPMMDIIAEGNMGVVKAIETFDPKKGCKFATYASWWVLDKIQSFILNFWSIVKMSSAGKCKKLFFGLSKIKSKIKSYHLLSKQEKINKIAEVSDLSTGEVESAMLRLEGKEVSSEEDFSYNLTAFGDDPESIVSNKYDANLKRQVLRSAMKVLSDQEQQVVNLKMQETKHTLVSIGKLLGVSAERVRQILATAVSKIKKYVNDAKIYF